MNETLKMTFVLGLISMIAGVALSFVYESTEARIALNKDKRLMDSLEKVLPEAKDFEEVEYSSEEVQRVFKGTDGNKVKGYAVLVKTAGFQGYITYIVGFNDEQMTGLEVLEHVETPGLGARIEEAVFKDRFREKKINDKIDAITGATVSSTAIIESAGRNLQKVKDELG